MLAFHNNKKYLGSSFTSTWFSNHVKFAWKCAHSYKNPTATPLNPIELIATVMYLATVQDVGCDFMFCKVYITDNILLKAMM